MLFALQKRLDADAIGLYEAVLGLLALRGLFPQPVESVPLDADQLWVRHVQTRLQAIIDGECVEPDEEEHWMDIWMTHRTVDLVAVESSVAELLSKPRERGRRDDAGTPPASRRDSSSAGEAAGDDQAG